MKSNTAEINLRAASNAPDTSLKEANLDEAKDINLYDELLAFSNLSPEEQEAAMNRPDPVSIIETSQPSPVEAPTLNPIDGFEPVEAYIPDTPPPQTNNTFFFEPPAQVAKEPTVDPVKQRVIEPVKEMASEPTQTNAVYKGSTADLQLAEILRVTGQLADLSTRTDSVTVCADCGSLADNEDVFCFNCGGSLEEVERAVSLSCSDCGAMIVSDEIFCPSCGSAMHDGDNSLF
jgi:RNA polymerase subunit RPABC4/transcription elongation factor Spt4